jgi:hypothetical protein
MLAILTDSKGSRKQGLLFCKKEAKNFYLFEFLLDKSFLLLFFKKEGLA